METRIHIPRNSYRGSDPKKLKKAQYENTVCAKVEIALQKRFDAQESGTVRAVMSHSIAHELDEDLELVRRIISRYSGGSNGATFWKPPLPGENWEFEKNIAVKEINIPKKASDEVSSDSNIKLDQCVYHAKFGSGRAVYIDGNKIIVDFDDNGRKHLISSSLS